MMQQDGASPLASDERASDGRDVTTILDADATIRYVSPSIEPILGYKPEQLVGQNWFQYVHPDDAAQALPGFGQTTQQPGIVQRNALRVRHANGSWVKVDEVGSNLLDYPGVHGWILSARNAGANGNTSATPTGSNGKNDGDASDTGAQCASPALASEQRLDALERSNRWYAQLLATLSHELRTPLNVVIGYHDLLLDGTFGTLSSEQSYALRRAHRSARELLDIITATLELSRLDAGRVALVSQTVATRALFDELGREMHELCDKPGVVLEWTVAADVPKLATDPAKLKMIAKHLVRNALHFSDPGTVTVAVRSHTEGLELAVSDTGAGSSHDALTAILAAPQQPDASTLERFGGSGLGLHTARRLVELLGGTMTVETELAIGSTIHVFIPLDAKAQRASRAPQ